MSKRFVLVNLIQMDEKEFVVTCQVLQQMWFGFTHDVVTMVVQDYLRDHPERGKLAVVALGLIGQKVSFEGGPTFTSRKSPVAAARGGKGATDPLKIKGGGAVTP